MTSLSFFSFLFLFLCCQVYRRGPLGPAFMYGVCFFGKFYKCIKVKKRRTEQNCALFSSIYVQYTLRQAFPFQNMRQMPQTHTFFTGLPRRFNHCNTANFFCQRKTFIKIKKQQKQLPPLFFICLSIRFCLLPRSPHRAPCGWGSLKWGTASSFHIARFPQRKCPSRILTAASGSCRSA